MSSEQRGDTIELIRRGVRRAPLVTLSLSFLLLAFSVALYRAPQGAPLIHEVIERWGNTYLRVSQGELWRLFTYAFLHASPSHLAFNLIGILILGTRVERLIGHIGLSSLFLGAASLGGLFSFIWRDYELSIGASGALYGLFGAELIFLIGLKRAAGVLTERRFNLGFLISALWLSLGLFMGLLNELNSEASSVDTATHFASLISGALLGGAMIITKSYRAPQASVRGVLTSLSPLLVSLSVIALAWLSRPSPPGFGGFVSRLAPQELRWRERQRELVSLSPAEQRVVWAQELLPPLTEMSLGLEALIKRRLERNPRSYQLSYAQSLSLYLKLWLEGARALSQEPLDPFAPPLAQLRYGLELGRGRSALLLAEQLRSSLTRFRDPERLQSKFSARRGLRSEALGLQPQLHLPPVEHLKSLGRSLELLDWIALIQLVEPEAEVERSRAIRGLSDCLLVAINSSSERALSAGSVEPLSADQGIDSASLSQEGGCQAPSPSHALLASLTLFQLSSATEPMSGARWLQLSLDLLTPLLRATPGERGWSPAPTRSSLRESLELAQSLKQLYLLWSQLIAQSYYDLLSAGLAEPLSALSERWRIVSQSADSWWGAQREAQRSELKIELRWREPLMLFEGPVLELSDLPPGPEAYLFAVFQETNGRHWLIEAPLPARLTTQTLLIPASCDELCGLNQPTLLETDPWSLEQGLEPPLMERISADGLWGDPYHLSQRSLSPLPRSWVLTGQDPEVSLSWRAWPVGVSGSVELR